MNIFACMHAESLQFCLTLCDPVDGSLPDSSVHGSLQTKSLDWVAMPSSRGSSGPRDQTCISCLMHWQACSLPLVPPRKPQWTSFHECFSQWNSLSCVWLLAVHRILQARILECIAFKNFSRGSSQPRDRTQVSHIAGGFFTSWATRETQECWSG